MDDDAVIPLRDFKVLTLALNVPGPVTAARLVGLGASVTKIEPPSGDPLAQVCPDWYQALSRHQEIIQLDLKSKIEKEKNEKKRKKVFQEVLCDLLDTPVQSPVLRPCLSDLV
ncbi:MAG: hypothetical protein BMS9Abin11_0976 [Gammaproteobacteria bacterium]|nr:MAG: hypothetical protein BMS9Abin11_0976 [Gammaproteobacteria bacterium]